MSTVRTYEPDDVDAALVESDRLAGTGRYREAIDLLSSAPGARDDVRLARKARELRWHAFEHCERHAEPPPWPEPAPVPTGADGLPEAAWADVTPAMVRGALDTAGALLVRGMVSTSTADHLRAGIDRVFAAYDRSVEDQPGGADPGEEGWYDPFMEAGSTIHLTRDWLRQGGGIMAADSPHFFAEVLDTHRSTGLVSLVTEYFGEGPALSLDKFALRRFSTGGGIEWHQDGAFLGLEARALNVWLAVSACGRDAPGLDIVPHSFDSVVETGSGSASYQWSVDDQVARATAGTIATPEFAAGDAVLFDGRLLHRTSVDESMTKDRYAIETWFFGPSSFPDQQQVPFLV